MIGHRGHRGHRCKAVPNDKSAVLDVIAGFKIINDVSVRDWQELELGMVVEATSDSDSRRP